jgi:hypothetical protein
MTMRRCLSIAFAAALAFALAGRTAAAEPAAPAGVPDPSALRALALNI